MQKLIVVLLFFSVFAAACGDSSSDIFSAAADSSADDGGSPGSTGGSDSTDDDSTVGSDSTDNSGGEGAGGDFCEFVAAASDRFDVADFDNPGAFEEVYRDVINDYQSAARFAPDAIKDDIALLLDSADDFMEALDEVDWDLAALSDDDPRLVNPEADAADDRLDAFCGID